MTLRKTLQTGALAAALATAPLGFAFAQAPAPADRNAMEERIERIWEDHVEMKACQGCDIDVEFEDGVATLTGEVPEERYKTLAASLARVDGVVRVDNRITIDARTATDKLRDGLNKAADATVGAVAGASEAAGDAWITSKVKAKITTTEALEHSRIEVRTVNNRVTLTGTVPSAEARTVAVQLARGIEGVRDVVDKLQVK